MADKEIGADATRRSPGPARLEELDDNAVLDAIRRAECDADAGRIAQHDDVKKRIESWLSKPTR
jgi:predicted transcriptional regulator